MNTIKIIVIMLTLNIFIAMFQLMVDSTDPISANDQVINKFDSIGFDPDSFQRSADEEAENKNIIERAIYAVDTTIGNTMEMGAQIKDVLNLLFDPFSGVPSEADMENDPEISSFVVLLARMIAFFRSVLIVTSAILIYDKFKNRKVD